MKEAYTKALGLGLGFDFSRVEYDATTDAFKVDGSVPKGWELHKFVLTYGEDTYQGVVAEHIGGNSDAVVHSEIEPHPWLTSQDAVLFVKDCIQALA